jgi:hypothetical protein
MTRAAAWCMLGVTWLKTWGVVTTVKRPSIGFSRLQIRALDAQVVEPGAPGRANAVRKRAVLAASTGRGRPVAPNTAIVSWRIPLGDQLQRAGYGPLAVVPAL